MIRKIKNSRLIRHGALFAFFSFLNNGISFILLLILAGLFTPAEYGLLNLFTTIVTVVSLVISLNTMGYLSISFFKKSKIEIQEIINCILIVSFGVFLILFFVILLFPSFFTNIVGIDYHYQLVALVICLFQVLNNLRLEIWRLEEKPVFYGFFTLGNVLMNFLLTLFLVIQLKMGWTGRVYSQFIVYGGFFLISLILLFRQRYLVKLFPSKYIFSESLSYGVPLIPHSISTWLRQGLDRYIINFFLGVAQVGYFSFAFNIYNIMIMIGTAFNATNSVHIFKSLSKEETGVREKLRKQIKWMCLFFIIISFFVFGSIYLLVPVFFPQYLPAINYLLPLTLAGLFQCLYLLFVNFLFFYKKTKVLMYITFTISVLHMLFSFWLTRYGLEYTVYITLISNILIFLIVAFYANQYIGFKLFPKKDNTHS